jgi:hypothetical protein
LNIVNGFSAQRSTFRVWTYFVHYTFGLLDSCLVKLRGKGTKHDLPLHIGFNHRRCASCAFIRFSFTLQYIQIFFSTNAETRDLSPHSHSRKRRKLEHAASISHQPISNFSVTNDPEPEPPTSEIKSGESVVTLRKMIHGQLEYTPPQKQCVMPTFYYFSPSGLVQTWKICSS